MVCINWLHSVVFRLEAVPFFLTKEPFNCGLVVDQRDYDIYRLQPYRDVVQ